MSQVICYSHEGRAFERIGAPVDRIQVVGNLKFDVPAAAGTIRPQPADAGAMIVAGSTHPPEERSLMVAFRKLRVEFPTLVLVVAPRHVERARATRRLVERSGLRAAVWSRQADDAPGCDVLILDRLGLLPLFYASADVVVVGGTFIPIGGHNLLEPAACGRAIVAGPYCDHVHQAARDLEQAAALVRVAAGGSLDVSLYDTVRSLLLNPARRDAMGASARHYVEAHRGPARRYAAIVAQTLVPRRAPDAFRAGQHGEQGMD